MSVKIWVCVLRIVGVTTDMIHADRHAHVLSLASEAEASFSRGKSKITFAGARRVGGTSKDKHPAEVFGGVVNRFGDARSTPHATDPCGIHASSLC